MPDRFAVLALILVAGGCAGTPSEPPAVAPPTVEAAAAPAPAPRAIELAPFTQSLAGTEVAFEMVPVPGGPVTMPDGSVVEVPSFWIARTETTWNLYDVFVYELDKESRAGDEPEADAATRPSRPYVAPDRGYGHEGYAAISLASRGAEAFCTWLSLKTGRSYALPTEAQWRRAAALGGVTRDTAPDHAWFEDNADWEPRPVATKAADALGLFDLWGNVREWCVDAEGTPIALGGSFQDPLDRLGPDGREYKTPDWQVTDPQVPKSPWWLSDAPFMGCRVVCIPGPQGAAAPSPASND